MGNGPSDGPSSVLLVGFMASGKTAVGKEIARLSGWRVVDVDRDIETEAGASISDLFATRGEAWFRREEDRRTRRALDLQGVVVVPGGGWATFPGRMESLPPHVASIWLQVSPETALERARRDGDSRPLLRGSERSLEDARKLLASREPFYRLAALHLDTEGHEPLELAGEIVEFLRRDETRRSALDCE